MTLNIEPPLKKLKTSANDNELCIKVIDKCIQDIADSNKNLDPVLSGEFNDNLKLVKVFVGIVADTKDLSRVVTTLNEKIPLKELQHLKRVRKKEVLLCPISFIIGFSSIQHYIKHYVVELEDVFQYFKVLDVPYSPPKLKKQFKEYNKVWSCNFHPNAYLEKLVSGDFFTELEVSYHKTYMKMAFEVSKWYIQHHNIASVDGDDIYKHINGAIVVDPIIQSVVAVSFDDRDSNPIQHASMVAIDNVAKTQGGGVWDDTEEKQSSDRKTSGVSEEVLTHLKVKFPGVKFGARKFTSKKENDVSCEKFSDNLSESPYLCTGYYVYLVREPCIMCSMALVHARAKRIFFCFDNIHNGALKSKCKLQTISSLNHHFEVFTGFV